MADDAAFPPPWPLQLLTLILSLFGDPSSDQSVSSAASLNDAHVLLNFKSTLTFAGPSGAAPVASWAEGVVGPCVGHNVSTWLGVFCEDGRVVAVMLEGVGLAGSLDLEVLTGLPGLRYLGFSNNGLEGPLPDITLLPDLKAVYMTKNRFSGEIPEGVFKSMRALKKVWLSENGFSGRIPSSLKEPTKLMEVGLHGNRFEGGIPEMWQPELSLVNVAGNNLEGPIPSRLSKMSVSFFEGNKNLCGPPLANPCPTPSQKKHPSTALIVIIVLVVSLLLLLLLFCFIVCLRRRRRKREDRSDQLRTTEFGRIEQLPVQNAEAGPSERQGRGGGGAGAGAGGGRGGGGGGKKVPKKEQGKLSFIAEERRTFDLPDLLKAAAEVLGSGNFGSSYKASLVGGQVIVVKRFKEMNGVGREDFQEHMRRMGRLCHPNLLSLVAYYYRKEEKLIITDYIPGGSLAHMLHGSNGSKDTALDWPTRLKIIKGMTRGLAYLYDELPMLTVPHGHLKSSNVLLTSSKEPMLADYALVPVMNKVTASKVMMAFKAPECAQGKPCKKSDVWSFGILILEILTGKFPANYLKQGSADADLANWVNSVVKEKWTGEVFDKNMKVSKNNEEEMLKLLQIGLDCCETNVDDRLELKDAAERIEALKEGEGDDVERDERYASKAARDHEPSAFSR